MGKVKGQDLYEILLAVGEFTDHHPIVRALNSAGYSVRLLILKNNYLNEIDSNILACTVAIVELKAENSFGYELMSRLRKDAPDSQIITIGKSDNSYEAIEAERQGAFWYLSEPIQIEQLLFVIARACIVFELSKQNRILLNTVSTPSIPIDNIHGEYCAINEEKIRRLSSSSTTLLITGETGTGKTTLARLIHQRGNRSNKPFICVSCSAIPRDLIEAELFGHERGAFTGALGTRIGNIELANGGTLFLDEIGELPQDLQAKFLNFLQDREIKRLGSSISIPVDVRVIAATNANLEELIAERRFREDLFYRINVARYHVAPLRERPELIQSIAENLLSTSAKKLGVRPRTLTPGALARIRNYNWPGNIRELSNVLERAVLFSEPPFITDSDLELNTNKNNINNMTVKNESLKNFRLSGYSLDDIEREAIVQTLEAFNYDKRQAAEKLQISVKSVYNKLKKHRIIL